MTIQFLPAITPSRSSFKIVPASQAIFNPYSKVETIIEEPGDKWSVSLSWRFLKPIELRELRSFLHSLRGQSGRCYIRDSAHANTGSWAGAPKVGAAGQYGNLLSVVGFTANRTAVANPGDRFTLNGRLHEVTAVVNSNSTGAATIRFEPEIITPPAANTPLIFTQPYGTFMMRDPSQIPDFSQAKSGARDVSIGFIEALR